LIIGLQFNFRLAHILPLICSIRAIDADIKDKNGTIERIDDESKDLKERMAVMVEHLKNVQQELINTQQLIEAKTKEVWFQDIRSLQIAPRDCLLQVEAEDHLKQLAERETGRIFQVWPEYCTLHESRSGWYSLLSHVD
jgi:DNA anti-recombination protein RmuC